ncbi:MAG: hypothetical protein ACK4EX_10555 [Thermaurantimonas sp.]|uniref:hypothetical protein n=1 Tax=Thermaurantimonas sp. TaxID=2681568 RepID=UPI00391B6A66
MLSKALNHELDRIVLSYGHSLTGQSPSVKFSELIKLQQNDNGPEGVILIE